ncbi:DNA-binding FadR family transcriptional regulator [Novosphingobium sp. PhB165]|uniref:GntR family transcriptional regulator n=1 Tax=Novosphingobium sp. PhB165 TaxID=2485105 RepID=UPI001047DF56|nr:GntR family transcriptional regulator [Novosphingobium sp. PhB165]TCM14599.1 DNA-binding FadR family transcriptional regulator [Novosphingobium sp. PhB165]
MDKRKSRTALDTAADKLREIVLAREPGTYIGREEALISELGFARATVRQAARLVEREGFLAVRRGNAGGYFASRPDSKTIESIVSMYLSMMEVPPEDVTVIATALWVEAMRKAAHAPHNVIVEKTATLVERTRAVADDAGFDEVRELERATQDIVFELADSAYIKLIFDINVAFSRRTYQGPAADDVSPEHRRFVQSWRNARLMEFGALIQGDPELAAIASQYSRKVWARRIRARFQMKAEQEVPD